MRKTFASDFVFQVFSLVISFLIVHAIYIAEIRPMAAAFKKEQNALMKSNPTYVPQKSLHVILGDYEQESEIILMFWALAILSFKGLVAYRQQRHLDLDFIGIPENARISVDSARLIAERIVKNVPQKQQAYILPRVLLSAIDRFTTTRNVQDASTVVHSTCESEGDRAESELSVIRYIAWAIPSIGFIGTVRGIGDALSQANQAVHGDITGVTDSLGVAFNSTLIALLVSIVLMFIIHHVQLMQERLVLGTERYCESMLISRLQV